MKVEKKGQAHLPISQSTTSSTSLGASFKMMTSFVLGTDGLALFRANCSWASRFETLGGRSMVPPAVGPGMNMSGGS
jgi:hypothetical protein